MAVSKTFPVEKIMEAYLAGHRDFGENKVQELLVKKAELPKDIRWHFIGQLQSNKARKAAEASHLIHSIDSASQLNKINNLESETGVLVQVNIAEESQKSGVVQEKLDSFLETVAQYEKIRLQGLMTIGPLPSDPEDSRPLFQELNRLAEEKALTIRSMGMSADFEVALQEGATHVRVGSAIFGKRTTEGT